MTFSELGSVKSRCRHGASFGFHVGAAFSRDQRASKMTISRLKAAPTGDVNPVLHGIRKLSLIILINTSNYHDNLK